jgi:hypothetical protein
MGQRAARFVDLDVRFHADAERPGIVVAFERRLPEQIRFVRPAIGMKGILCPSF